MTDLSKVQLKADRSQVMVERYFYSCSASTGSTQSVREDEVIGDESLGSVWGVSHTDK